MSEFCNSPLDYQKPPKNNKGGPGVYDGETGYPGRTSSPDAVPEKVRDGNVPDSKSGLEIDTPAQMPK